MKIVKNNAKRMQPIDEVCTVATTPAFNKNVVMKCMGVLLPLVRNKTAVGLACNQIGITNARVFLAVVNNKIKIFINPTITKYSGKIISLKESCLSVPGKSITTDRYESICIEYTSIETPKSIQFETYTGYDARIIQHEINHLNGQTILGKKEVKVDTVKERRNRGNAVKSIGKNKKVQHRATKSVSNDSKDNKSKRSSKRRTKRTKKGT